MDTGRITSQQMADQARQSLGEAWKSLRDHEVDIKRIFKECTQPGDESIVRAVTGYVLARMHLEDSKMEEEREIVIELVTLKRSLDLLVCLAECDSCGHEEECYALTEAIDKLENE